MPHIGSTEVDVAGLQLIDDWIRRLPANDEAATLQVDLATTFEELGVPDQQSTQQSTAEITTHEGETHARFDSQAI